MQEGKSLSDNTGGEAGQGQAEPVDVWQSFLGRGEIEFGREREISTGTASG